MSEKSGVSEDEEDFKCSYCEQLFKCKVEYERHVGYHKKVFDCEICEKPFSNVKCRIRHYYEMHSEVMLKCSSCDIVYTKLQEVDRHKKFHTKETPYLCLLCLKSYKSLKALKKHHDLHEQESEKSISMTELFDFDAAGPLDDLTTLQAGAIKPHAKLRTESYICHVCGKTFTLHRNFVRHILCHEPKGSYKCDICDRVFDLQIRLYDHKKYHKKKKSAVIGSRPGRPNPEEQVFPTTKIRPLCQTCGKSFCDARHLRRHRESHLPKGQFPCKLCDKVFDLNIKLKIHMVWHRRKARFLADPESGKTATFPCEYCGKVFLYSTSLSAHKQLHRECHHCTLCGRTFNKKWNLKTHMAIHLGNKPYSCSYCGASYADRSNLKKHLMKHPSDVEARVVVNRKPLVDPEFVPPASPEVPAN